MPNVRASSGTIGTTTLPISGSRSSFDSSRTNTIVVDAARPSVPLLELLEDLRIRGAGSGVVLLLRIGSEPAERLSALLQVPHLRAVVGGAVIRRLSRSVLREREC